jgi:glycerol-3-phosphate dehydrogenase
MPVISRNLQQAAREHYDLVIVGGGIYGAMLLLESVKAGLKPLLLEKADFGSGTSFNNLRIVHGGLRYLQSMHLSRIRESVAERRWYLETFPEFVRPLQCLMPLYGGLLKNRLALSIALLMNDWLSRNRNRDLPAGQEIPDGQVIDAGETRRRFPNVREQGLKGSAVWHDAVMPDCHRVLMEVLRWATAGGGTALNYAEATELVATDNRVSGVSVIDRVSGNSCEFQAAVVVNAAGPECRALSAHFDVERPELFHASVAWNLLLDRPPLSDGAVAIQAPRPKSRVYFAHSLGGRLVVGTGHAAVRDGDSLAVERAQVEQMLADVNMAIPGLELRPDEIVRVLGGQLPAAKAGTDILSDTPVFVDHHRSGGPRGLYSLSGVKYTTARSTAQAAIAQIIGAGEGRAAGATTGLRRRPESHAYELHPTLCPERTERIRRASVLVETEAPQSLEDLLIRRSNLAFDPAAALAIAEECCSAFDWDAQECVAQVARLKAGLDQAATPAAAKAKT